MHSAGLLLGMLGCRWRATPSAASNSRRGSTVHRARVRASEILAPPAVAL